MMGARRVMPALGARQRHGLVAKQLVQRGQPCAWTHASKCWRVLVIPASIGSTRCTGAGPALFSACVRCALAVLFVIGGSLAPAWGPFVLVDAILTPTREPSLLSSQIQQGPGHLPRLLGRS